MSALDTVKEKVNQTEELARNIWLAGLGAYGKGFDEAQDQYEKLTHEAGELFKELVKKGEKLESDAKNKFNEEKDSVKHKVDDRVAEVRAKLGLDNSGTEEKIEELSAKIEALTQAVAKLSN
jgi:poly(hydroxyalkanoate) granule-associated protein